MLSARIMGPIAGNQVAAGGDGARQLGEFGVHEPHSVTDREPYCPTQLAVGDHYALTKHLWVAQQDGKVS